MSEFKYWVFNPENVNLAYSHLFGLRFSFVRRDCEKTGDIRSQEIEGEEQKLLVAGHCGRAVYMIESQPPIKYLSVSNRDPKSKYPRPLNKCPQLKITVPFNSMVGMQLIIDDGILQPVNSCKLSEQFTEQREGGQ